ncbi:amidase family protein [Pandoraea apista]|uniref:amidase family protein n=1 Tax=Pandoraea apista TaxID=93218 RepID=UPI00248E8EC6|nr:amidase family protein [Pandoraea apista]
MVHQKSYERLRAGYASGEFSPVDVVISALNHAEELDQSLNAFALIDRERALRLADASAQRWRENRPLSRLDGMPITVKEGAAVEGWTTKKGSLVTSDSPAAASTEFVRRLFDSGAVILGKTRAPEFSWKGVTDSPGFGVTRNPLDRDLTPGGSSGGCAAAVCAGVVRVSIGSDAGGSVRIPAAFTGTFGLKPTYARIPMVPMASEYFDVAHWGPIAASVADMADVMEVIGGPSAGDHMSVGLAPVDYRSQGDGQPLRIGVLDATMWGNCCVEVKEGMEIAQSLLASRGAVLSSVGFDVHGASRVGDFFYRLGCQLVIQSIPDELRGNLDPRLPQFAKSAESVSMSDMVAAQKRRDEFGIDLHTLFDDIDVLMLPTLPILPFEAGRETPVNWPSDDWMSWNPYTPAFNVTRTPAISVPVFPTASSLPIGVQFVAAKCREDLLMRAASIFDAVGENTMRV